MSIFKKKAEVKEVIIKKRKTKTHLLNEKGELTTIKESKKSTITHFNPVWRKPWKTWKNKIHSDDSTPLLPQLPNIHEKQDRNQSIFSDRPKKKKKLISPNDSEASLWGNNFSF